MPDSASRWYFSKERLSDTPSRRHGYDSDKELSCRQQAANFIQDMGQKLHVSQLCINTAIVYMHRFYMFHSLVQFHRNAIATAALFLAAKVEEQTRKVEHVLKVAHLCLHRDNPTTLDPKSELYQEQSNELVINESILLQTLGFDVAIDHPHTHVVRCCQLVKASKDLAQTSYFMASNSLHLTTMCLQYQPTVVACFCIHLACKWSNWEIPRSSEGKDWFWYVNQTVTLDLLEQLTSEFLFIFDKCPTKLKKKMMSMNQSNPPVNLPPAVQGGSHQESYHFDEPRKLTGAEANKPPEAFLQAQAQQKAAEKLQNSNQSGEAPSVHPPRHIDYKEYKEKKERERVERERADREKLLREGYSMGTQQPQQPSSLGHSGHMIPKHSEKAIAQQLPPQQQQRQPAPVLQKYPQQQRPPHTGHSGVPPQKEAPIKEASKRKYEEVDNVASGTDLKKYPHKPSSHYPVMSSSKVHPPTEDHTASGIRDIITQSFPPREKPHQEQRYQNYPYQQRPPPSSTDKYGRSQQTSVIASAKDQSKRFEDMPGKIPKQEVEDSHGHGYSNVSQQPPVQKPRDPKYKGHAPQKHPGPPIPPASISHSSAPHHRKPTEKVIEKNRKYPSERLHMPSMSSLPTVDETSFKTSDSKRLPYSESIRKDRISPSKAVPKSKNPNPFKTSESLFNISDTELPNLLDSLEPPMKLIKKEYVSDMTRPHGFPLSDMSAKPVKTSSIFSPESNLSPKNLLSNIKEEKKSDVIIPPAPIKKQSSSLFSPPAVPTSVAPSHHRNSHGDRDHLLHPAKQEKRELSLPVFGESMIDIHPFKEEKNKMEHYSRSAQINTSALSEAGAVIYPPQERKPNQSFTEHKLVPETTSPISTVNLIGMERMVDTSIFAEKTVVIKPVAPIRSLPPLPSDQIPPKLIPPIIKEEKKEKEKEKVEEKEKPTPPKAPIQSLDDSDSSRKEKKRKEKDSHKHKEKKKKDKDSDKDNKKEKKKHKDKNRERKKDSHRDKDKVRDKDGSEAPPPPVPPTETHLKITIPKDKINLTSHDAPSTGLKMKIAKSRLKPEDTEVNKSSSSASEGGLKIKIKKDAITSYKDEGKSSSKKKESSSHSSHHKSSRSSEKKSSRSSDHGRSSKTDSKLNSSGQ